MIVFSDADKERFDQFNAYSREVAAGRLSFFAAEMCHCPNPDFQLALLHLLKYSSFCILKELHLNLNMCKEFTVGCYTETQYTDGSFTHKPEKKFQNLCRLSSIPKKTRKFYDDKTNQTSEFNACDESNYW